MHSDAEDQSQPTALHLWRVLRHYLEHACFLIGMPARIAQKIWLTRAEHRGMTNILRPLEDLLRRLIFLEAVQLAPEPLQPEAKQQPRSAMPASFGAPFDADHPETWRVSLKLAPATERRLPAGNASDAQQAVLRPDAGSPSARISAAPVALRLEALIRGFNDPAPLARRLARRLARDAEAADAFSARPPKRVASHPMGHSVVQAGALCAAFKPLVAPTDSS